MYPATDSKADRLSPGLGVAVALVSALLVLVAAELVISHGTSMGTPPRKTPFQTTRGFGHCYRSHDPSLPIDVLDGRAVADLSAILLGSVQDMVREGATRCVTYDVRARRRGTHPERARQVAIVGDSFAFGEGLPDDKTLGALLSDRFPAIGFPSFAVSGAGVLQVEGQVDRALSDPRKPSDIIYFYNINDVTMTQEMSARFSYAMDFENFRWKEGSPKGGDTFWERKSALVEVAESASFLWTMTRVTTQNYLDMYFADVNEPALEETLASLSRMAQRAREHGVGFHFVVFPLLHKDLWGRYPFASIHRLLMDACKGWKARCIDGSRAFADRRRMKSFVVDRSDFHPNELANRKMVDLLAAEPSFLEGATSGPPRTLEVSPFTVPRSGLGHTSPGVTVEGVEGRPGEYPASGPMFSATVRPVHPGTFSVGVRARATPCRDPGGEEWPSIEVYAGDRRVARLRVATKDVRTFTTEEVRLEGDVLLRFFFSADYEDQHCDRIVYVDDFDVNSVSVSRP